MSATLADQTLTLNKSTTIPMDQYPLAYVDWIVLINASPFALQATFGGSALHVPAWYYYPVNIQGKTTQTPTVLPYLQTIPGVGFTKTLSAILYMQNEQPDVLLPQPLGGGPVDLTIASSINQTGQPAGNSVIFAEPVNDTSVTGAVSLDNQGHLVLGDATYNGSIAILGASLRQISISLTGYFREFDVSGNLSVDLEPGFLQMYDASGNRDIDLEPGSVTINGSVSGTAVAYQIFRGTFKYTIVILNSWRSAGAVNITLPVAYTKGARCTTGGIGASAGGDGGFKLLSASNPQTIRVITALASTGGTVTSVTQMFENSMGECITGFDQVAVWSNVNPHSGFIILEGI